jgi:inhibitor of cysteine peptidase
MAQQKVFAGVPTKRVVASLENAERRRAMRLFFGSFNRTMGLAVLLALLAGGFAICRVGGAGSQSAASNQESAVVTVTSPLSAKSEIPVAVASGAKFTITLPANHTTGYQWRLAGSPSKKVLRSSGSTYIQTASGLVGSGGSEKWSFESVGKGKTTFKLEYIRPWEKGVPPIKSQTFVVTAS